MRGTWIWYPGDFEIMHFNKCMAKRYERDVMITPFWRMDGYYCNVKFYREFELTRENHIRIRAEGNFNVFLEGTGYVKDFGGVLVLPAGLHRMSVLVNNNAGLPCIFVEGEELASDGSFLVTCQDHEFKPAGFWNFAEEESPNDFRLPVIPRQFSSREETGEGTLFDFGREVTAYLRFRKVPAGRTLAVYYGESREEALDTAYSEQTDRLSSDPADGSGELVTRIPKSFRYAFVEGEGTFEADLLEEQSPGKNRSRFVCSDPLLQRIWDTSIRTIELTTREFLLDGAKRDRWSWSGDALQSEWLSYYSFFDVGTVKRTIRALAGKPPVKTHVNHIMDYTSYWILSLYDCYRYTGDAEFVREMYPSAEAFASFCIGRTNEEGFLDRRENDWVFIDWAEMDNDGETSFEQILFAAALFAMAKLAVLAGRDGSAYAARAERLRADTIRVFWRDGRFLHGRKKGVLGDKVTRYANIFAILYDLADSKMREQIVGNVLTNPEVQKIVTPYMRFYELIALCKAGRCGETAAELKRYWGGMLAEGATTFWEKYDPDEHGAEKYAMYGRPYGKSLCHAWGASPVYLIARCLFGIEPAEPGYRTFVCRPCPEVLPVCRLTVPTPRGSVTARFGDGKLWVSNENCAGTLILTAASGEETEITVPENGSVCVPAGGWKDAL